VQLAEPDLTVLGTFARTAGVADRLRAGLSVRVSSDDAAGTIRLEVA
jgi:hypothetical protein